MPTRLFLGLNVLIWLPYGIMCFLDPGLLAESASVEASSATGTTELRAMYGGLQASIGVWCALALWKPSLAGSALTALIVLPAGLATTRLTGALIDGEFATYTLGALALEITLASVAVFLLRRAVA